MARKDLAVRIGRSVSYLSVLESGKKSQRGVSVPKRQVINDIATALQLSFEQRNALLKAARQEPVKARPEVTEDIYSVLTGLALSVRETELLVGELKAYAQRWKSRRDARSKDVEKAVIIAAGWQARLLAEDQLETMILHAASEVAAAKIVQVGIVIAPTKSMARFDRVRSEVKVHLKPHKPETLQVSVIIQEEPLGLGDAIRSTRSFIGEEPFAVILPVDVDPNRETLKEMKLCYSRKRTPMLAVNPTQTLPAAELQHYGLALLEDAAVEGEDQLFYIKEMQETRTGPNAIQNTRPTARMITGRYILTPDIFDVLQSTRPNSQTKKVEITDALETFRRNNHRVCAYVLRNPLLPLAPVRALMVSLIESINRPEKLEKMIEAARAALGAGTNLLTS